MKDNQKKYLDKVVDLIVRDTVIDYEKEKVYTSHLSFSSYYLSIDFYQSLPLYIHNPISSLFSKYCKNTYGIVENEIDYVWDQYRVIIKGKITTK